ncbi:ABC transporter ATP-binding protein [candidate division WWE3 bacterium]|uniref:ABC transporter ATP-binding protein n=1 Tax=candidate division WWE3 bacterium TaxID=2053526 RepID=A0A955LKK0_UNCKA|nr:ABC transporter ATP-binding protein [candidate division WWE3 bacterium]
MEPIIHVENLIKRYNKAKESAVNGVSFDVRDGEFFTFLGPNGAGKTTTISILTTTLSKSSGKVEVLGKDIEKDASYIRQNLGIIFQKPSLDENLTAEENIRFHAILYNLYTFSPTYGLMPKAYKDRVMNLAELLGIQKEMFNPIKSFSGGMKRKLEIIRSLMHDPKILFLDEPTTGLDPVSRNNLWDYLQEVRQNAKTTIFLTTHYLEEAEGSDVVCIINNGKIMMQGMPREIKNQLVSPHLVFESKERERLSEELKVKGYRFQEKDGKFIVEFGDRRGQEIIKSIDTPIHRIDINNPTLEEAYVKLVEGGGETG